MKSFFGLLLSILCLLTAQAQTTPPLRKTTIIYILADDLRYFYLACYGNPYNETPHLDSLA